MSISSIGAGNIASPFVRDDTQTTTSEPPAASTNAAASQTSSNDAASVEISSSYKAPKLTPEEWATLRADRKAQHDTYVSGLKAATAQKHADWEATDTVQDAQEAAQLAHWAEVKAARHKP